MKGLPSRASLPSTNPYEIPGEQRDKQKCWSVYQSYTAACPMHPFVLGNVFKLMHINRLYWMMIEVIQNA